VSEQLEQAGRGLGSSAGRHANWDEEMSGVRSRHFLTYYLPAVGSVCLSLALALLSPMLGIACAKVAGYRENFEPVRQFIFRLAVTSALRSTESTRPRPRAVVARQRDSTSMELTSTSWELHDDEYRQLGNSPVKFQRGNVQAFIRRVFVRRISGGECLGENCSCNFRRIVKSPCRIAILELKW